MSRNLLKTELTILERQFPRTHGVFQMISTSSEELVCQFTDIKQKKHTFQCNLSPSYPRILPLWTSDSDHPFVTALVEDLNASDEVSVGASHPLLFKIRHLITKMCGQFGVRVPEVVAELLSLASSAQVEESPSEDEGQENDYDLSDQDDDDDNYDEPGLFEEDCDSGNDDDHDQDKMDEKGKAVLDKIRMTTHEDYLKGNATGSIRASDRLMRELSDIYKSDSYRKGIFSVELIDDNLYNWYIKLYRVDPDSPLASDIKKLKEKEGQDYILLHMSFESTFPYTPPFLRVVKPYMAGGYVLAGGAICMELLTPQGWSSVYAIESLILQVSATFVKGKGRIQFGQSSKSQYTLATAQHAYKSLVKIHKENGWFTPPKDEG